MGSNENIIEQQKTGYLLRFRCRVTGDSRNKFSVMGAYSMEYIIELVLQTGMVIGIMACVTGGVIGAVKLVETAGRFRCRKRK